MISTDLLYFDLIFRELRKLKKTIVFMDATIDLNKIIQCANHCTTLLSYTRPWTAIFFDVFMLISIS